MIGSPRLVWLTDETLDGLQEYRFDFSLALDLALIGAGRGDITSPSDRAKLALVGQGGAAKIQFYARGLAVDIDGMAPLWADRRVCARQLNIGQPQHDHVFG